MCLKSFDRLPNYKDLTMGMGASTGQGRRVCIENDVTIWTMNRARFSTTSGDCAGRRHGRVSAGGGVEDVLELERIE